MMFDDAERRKMRAIADRVAVADNDDTVTLRCCRTDGGIDTEIGSPTDDQDPADAKSGQGCAEGRAVEGVVEGLANYEVVGISGECGEDRPPGRGGSKGITWRPFVLDEDHATASLPYA
jgi:hypothetical protein